MRVLLFHPKDGLLGSSHDFSPEVDAHKQLGPFSRRAEFAAGHPALLILGGLFPSAWEIEYVDENLGGKVDPKRGYQLAIGTGVTCQARRLYAVSDRLRRAGTRVLLFGPHVENLPLEARAHCDGVLVGDPEEALAVDIRMRFATAVAEPGHGRPARYDLLSSGAAVRSATERADAGRPAPALPVTAVGSPHRERGRLARAMAVCRPLALVALKASSGCPRGCAFCTETSGFGGGPSFRPRPLSTLVREISNVRESHPDASFVFADVNLGASPAFLERLAAALAPLRIRFTLHADLSIARRPDLLRTLRRAGLARLFVGFESLHAETLRTVAPFTARLLEHTDGLSREIARAGIGLLGSFILGFDTERPDEPERLAARLDALPLLGLTVSLLTPLPGTAYFDDLAAAGRLRTRNYDRYTQFHEVMRFRHHARGALPRKVREIYRVFHDAPARAGRVASLRNLVAA